MRRVLLLTLLLLISISFASAQCTDGSLTAPNFVVGNTVSATDDCSLNSLSRDHTIEVVIPCGGDWTFSTCDPSTNFDTWLFLGNSCCGGSLASNDNYCGPQSQFTASLSSGTYFATIEAFGTSIAGDYTLSVSDATDPQISCPTNIVKSNDFGNCSGVVTYTPPVGTDNCAGGSTSMTSGLGSGASFPVGVNIEEYVVSDASNNKDTCTFTITVNDTELPEVNCPNDTILIADAGMCTTSYTYIAPTGTDNCSGSSTALASGNGPGTLFSVGVNPEIYVVTDPSNNTDTCIINVTVQDLQDPVISCPVDTTVFNDPNICSAVVSYTAPVGTDNCIGVTNLVTGFGNGGTFPIGKTLETYVVSDPSGNTDTCTFNVTVESSLSVAGLVTNQISCFGQSDGEATVNVTGGCPSYSYLWMPSGQTGLSANSLPAGTHYVTVTDGSVAIALDSVVIIEPATLSGTLSSTGNLCSSTNIGTVNLIVSGGTPSFSFAWNIGSTSQNLINQPGGTYVVTITDTMNCTWTDSVVVTQPDPLQLTFQQVDETCEGALDGSINITVTGGTLPYSYNWSSGPNTEDISNLSGGVYSVSVLDFNNCNVGDTMTLATNSLPSPTITQNALQLCAPVGFVMYQWNLSGGPVIGATNQCFTPLVNGAYSVTVTDNNGCEGTSAPFNYIVGIEEDKLLSQIRIYPNPASTTLHIKSEEVISGDVSIQLLDISGKQLIQLKRNNLYEVVSLDLSQISRGVYFVRISTEKGRIAKRIMVE